ncbi:hypothetical protein ZIOFF_017553 [Zingiber officinale]|uniref:HVA22-like protein n=2 Tax=Zingiber officinale TaxID=94328 RepID=A0A8J5LAB0_ZINOF|nr:hypothetical protein ZIOFF_017553 [Zingiber officinale]
MGEWRRPAKATAASFPSPLRPNFHIDPANYSHHFSSFISIADWGRKEGEFQGNQSASSSIEGIFEIHIVARGHRKELPSGKMFAEYITKLLLVFFGYAYPAFECFKTLEQPHGNYTVQLRFWCQYWIIVAILTVVEMLLEVLVSLIPMYGEAKVAFLVYLWYPKTKGSDLVYETFLRPVVMQYEPNIEERFRNLRPKLGQLLVFYLRNFTERGYTLFQDVLQYVVSRRSGNEKIKGSSSKNKKHDELEDFAEALLGTNAKQRPSRQRK